MEKTVAQMRRTRSRREMELVCGTMLRSFGGVEGFSQRWAMHVARAMEQPGFTAFRCLDALLKLLDRYDDTCRTAHAAATRRYQRMSDDELEAELQRCSQAFQAE